MSARDSRISRRNGDREISARGLDRTRGAHRRRPSLALRQLLGQLVGVALAVLVVLAAGRAKAEGSAQREPLGSSVPELAPPANVSQLVGKPITSIEIITLGQRWHRPVTLERVRVSQPFSAEIARRAMRELSSTGAYANVTAEADANGRGVALRLKVLPRRIVRQVRFIGTPFDEETTRRYADLSDGMEVTDFTLPALQTKLRQFYGVRGYPAAAVRLDVVDTDDPLEVILIVNVEVGPAQTVERLTFRVTPAMTPDVSRILAEYGVTAGDRTDDHEFDAADKQLQDVLRRKGWHRARVSHGLESEENRVRLIVKVDSGPRVSLRFEGNRTFDTGALLAHLELDDADDLSPARLASRVREYYVMRGFFDAAITPIERTSADETEAQLVLHVTEHRRVRVAQREYPCLTGARTADEVGEEIDSFLSESLPGADVLGEVDTAMINEAMGPQRAGRRVRPLELNPWGSYSPEVYDRATEHLQELYRSEGYLSATVGPVVLVRRRCDPSSPGRCIPLGDPMRPPTSCPTADSRLPVADPTPPPGVTCVADHERGVECEPNVLLHIPIKLGPKATLWDIAFEGNQALIEEQLFDALDLELGVPVSQAELEKGRQRLFDAYAEEGFAFASIEVELDLSPDHTRARVRFVISEREQVRVRSIVVRGADRTRESLILGRVAFEVGELYRRSDVQKTEERLATLGVFSNVVVGLENPNVPAREKTVVITVQERQPQYLDVSPGFSTGEGMRIAFEYGHRNLASRAIQLTLRVQLAYLPDPFILDQQVRENYADLPLIRRLERRNTATLQFPEIGLGPLFRFAIDAVDARDNSRDFGVTKDAGILTLQFRPSTRISAVLGPSFEVNDAEIFREETLEDYIRRVGANPEVLRLLAVPQGRSFVIAQRIGATWDRRDSPFGATQGTFVSGTVEHVNAFAAEDNENPVDAHFLRYRGRVAGYLRLYKNGLALAASLSVGFNQQLDDRSRTYPDRLFFLGGESSMRGFLQAQVVPEDIAARILDPDDPLTVEDVAVRGGDLLLNPRLELRIPIGAGFQTAVFLDTGNLWADPTTADPTKLRYAAGTGIRFGTPIGPLALDYGIVLDRRPWEDFGNIHFSVGLF